MATVKMMFADDSGKEHPTMDEAVAHDLVLAGAISNIVFAREVVKNRVIIAEMLKQLNVKEPA